MASTTLFLAYIGSQCIITCTISFPLTIIFMFLLLTFIDFTENLSNVEDCVKQTLASLSPCPFEMNSRSLGDMYVELSHNLHYIVFIDSTIRFVAYRRSQCILTFTSSFPLTRIFIV